MKIVYTTDLHGDMDLYEKVLDVARSKEIKALVFGGDITPLGFFDAIIHSQREFMEKFLIPRLREFKKKEGKDIFIMMGNDDFRVNMDVLEKAEKEGVIKILHKKVHKLNRLFIAGYTCVNPTPFMLKDWDREENVIKNDLDKLSKKSDPKKTVYVFHAPPFNTELDVLYNGEHKGSKAIKDFILNKKPYLTFHGHIHESPDMTGKFSEKIGDTLSINPGDGNIVIVDLDNLKVKHIRSG